MVIWSLWRVQAGTSVAWVSRTRRAERGENRVQVGEIDHTVAVGVAVARGLPDDHAVVAECTA